MTETGTDGLPVEGALTLALHVAELELALEHAFYAESDAPETAEKQRQRYSLALLAVARFVEATLSQYPVAKRFRDLASALNDLDVGSQSPFLVPVKYGNRPVGTSLVWEARASVCVILKMLITAGLTQQAAAEYIARKSAAVRSMTAKSKSTTRTILSWADAFSRRTVNSERGMAAYDWNLEFALAQIAAVSEAKKVASAKKVALALLSRLANNTRS